MPRCHLPYKALTLCWGLTLFTAFTQAQSVQPELPRRGFSAGVGVGSVMSGLRNLGHCAPFISGSPSDYDGWIRGTGVLALEYHWMVGDWWEFGVTGAYHYQRTYCNIDLSAGIDRVLESTFHTSSLCFRFRYYYNRLPRFAIYSALAIGGMHISGTRTIKEEETPTGPLVLISTRSYDEPLPTGQLTFCGI